jgi:ribonuclease P protein component
MFGLPRAWQLRSARDYQRVFAAKCSARDGVLIAYVVANGLAVSRMGSAIGKKGRNAIIRNRIRRVLREAYRLERPLLPVGWDWILLVPKDLHDLQLEPTRRSVQRLARRLAVRVAKHVPQPRGVEPSTISNQEVDAIGSDESRQVMAPGGPIREE